MAECVLLHAAADLLDTLIRQWHHVAVVDHQRPVAQVDAHRRRVALIQTQCGSIDDDLGLSGRSGDHRSGFRELVGRVCVGEVGAIFGLEISRLARSSADLSRLLALARLTDTLIVDGDGVYDLGDFNDRLLLGLKSTMSEALVCA